MKNVLVFGMTENPGGVESVILNNVLNMDKDAAHFDYLCNTDTVAYSDILEKQGSKIIHIPMRSKDKKAYKQAMESFFSTEGKNYDAIWVNVCSLANIDYLAYAKKYGIPRRIIHSHNSQNMDSKLRGVLHKLNKSKISTVATDFWACSQEAADWFYSPQLQKERPPVVLNNGIEVDKYKFNQGQRKRIREKYGAENKLVIGNVGRLHFQKNQTFLLDIFAEMVKQRPESELWLVGQGEDQQKLKDKVKELNLEDKVKFLGITNEVENILQAMDVFVFPSLFEGLPLALVEAQAASLPCIVSGTIPQAVKMTDHLEFLSLDKSAKEWAEAILKSDLERKERDVSGISEAGYDIKTVANKIQTMLEAS